MPLVLLNMGCLCIKNDTVSIKRGQFPIKILKAIVCSPSNFTCLIKDFNYPLL